MYMFDIFLIFVAMVIVVFFSIITNSRPIFPRLVIVEVT